MKKYVLFFLLAATFWGLKAQHTSSIVDPFYKDATTGFSTSRFDSLKTDTLYRSLFMAHLLFHENKKTYTKDILLSHAALEIIPNTSTPWARATRIYKAQDEIFGMAYKIENESDSLALTLNNRTYCLSAIAEGEDVYIHHLEQTLIPSALGEILVLTCQENIPLYRNGNDKQKILWLLKGSQFAFLVLSNENQPPFAIPPRLLH